MKDPTQASILVTLQQEQETKATGLDQQVTENKLATNHNFDLLITTFTN